MNLSLRYSAPTKLSLIELVNRLTFQGPVKLWKSN